MWNCPVSPRQNTVMLSCILVCICISPVVIDFILSLVGNWNYLLFLLDDMLLSSSGCAVISSRDVVGVGRCRYKGWLGPVAEWSRAADSVDWRLAQWADELPALYNCLITPSRYVGDGVLFSIDLFVCLFLSFFVSLLARLWQNSWTDLHEIFREGVEWPWDDLITLLVNSKKLHDAAMCNTGAGFVVL